MNSKELKQNICRICLDDSVALDWNATVYGYYDVTYKDCFYKYTQLEYHATDQFSPMLCQICLNGLYNVHTLIVKALESHKYFQETNLIAEHSTNLKEKYTPTEFETVLVGKTYVNTIREDDFAYKHLGDQSDIKTVKTKIRKRYKRSRNTLSTTARQEKCINNFCKLITEKKRENLRIDSDISPNEIEQTVNGSSHKCKRKTTKSLSKVIGQHGNLSEKQILGDDVTDDAPLEDIIKEAACKLKRKRKKPKNPRMCSICSKILSGTYAVQKHEETHIKDRERKEICNVCGLKFYDKRNLYSHQRIHKENRQKNHKCEYCNKAFYNKGGLNIHRRIHLGQMISCSLCTKQFYRQIDLERHMNSHSATIINTDTKKRSRYYVRCKYCDKSILSTSFKSHTAAHLNEPLMKCSICSKEFFLRGSCVHHVKKIHQKSNEEYNDFIILYKKNRISHLFLEQKSDIQCIAKKEEI